MPKEFGIDLSTPGVLKKIAPASIQRLAELLQLPENKDIHDVAIKGNTFGECLGIIAAMFDIVLDGNYDVPDLCDLLCKAITAKKTPGFKPTDISSKLKAVELVEHAKTLELIEAGGKIPVQAPKTVRLSNIEVLQNSTFMQSVGCAICNQIKLCREAMKCLGNSTEVHDEAVKKFGRLQ